MCTGPVIEEVPEDVLDQLILGDILSGPRMIAGVISTGDPPTLRVRRYAIPMYNVPHKAIPCSRPPDIAAAQSSSETIGCTKRPRQQY